MMDLTPSDRDYVIRTMIGEAANQGDEGLAAVAHVIMNRTGAGYGRSPREVVLARGQFEPWATRRDELLGYADTDPAYQRAAAVLDRVTRGETPDNTGGATHFLNEGVVRQRRGGSLPGWAQGEGKRIGDHTFYRPGESRKMDTSLFDKYDSGPEAKASAAALPAPDMSLFEKYDLGGAPPEQPPRVSVANPEKQPRGDPLSGFNNYMASSVPVLGPILDKATAAAGAAVQPLVGAQSDKTFGERYENNLLMQEQRKEDFARTNPLSASAAGATGTAMLLGPVAGTRWGASAMGMTGNSLGIKALKGATSMATLEVANQYLQGKDPRQQGFFGPVPVAAAAGAAGPMIQHGVSEGVNRLIEWKKPTSGALAGTTSVTRNKLLGTMEGENAASIADSVVSHGPSGRMMDMNQATRDIAGGLADIPGPAKAEIRETLRQRSAEQAGRLRETLDRNTVKHTDIAQLASDIEKSQKETAGPLYDAFRATRVPPTQVIKEDIIPRLEAAGAFTAAEELAGITGRPFTQKFFTGGPQKEFPTAEAWDLAKRGLDRKISAAYDKGDNVLGSALVKLKHDMIREVEKAPGGQVWRQAREAFAEHSALLDQLEAGQKTWHRTSTADELAQELKGLNANELAARRQGARDAINEIMTNTVNGDTTARNRMLTEAGRRKLELLFGEKRAARLIKDLEAEVKLSNNTNEIVGGSPTSSKQARRDALLPERREPGYLANVDLTRPSTLWPEWATPRAILEGESVARHTRSREELGRFMQLPMQGPEFRDLLRAISGEGARRAAGSAYAGRLSNSAGPLVQSTSAPLRNRLTEPLNSEPRLEGSSR